MSENETDFGAYIAGFIIGGLVGAAAALLLAPQSGEETRTLIRDKSIELKDKAAASAEEAYEKATAALEDTRTKLVSTVEDLRKRVDDLAVQMSKESKEAAATGTETPPPPVGPAPTV
jgi:gas vesicle protein